MPISTATCNIIKISSLLSIYNPRPALKYCSATLVPSITEFKISTSKLFKHHLHSTMIWSYQQKVSLLSSLTPWLIFFLFTKLLLMNRILSLHYLKLYFHNPYKKHACQVHTSLKHRTRQKTYTMHCWHQYPSLTEVFKNVFEWWKAFFKLLNFYFITSLFLLLRI